MIIKTKLNNHYQTTIPKEIREKLNADNATYIQWRLDQKNKQAIIKFIKKPSLMDIAKLQSTKR